MPTPRFRTVWLVTFVLIVAIGTLWSLAQPLFSGADEPMHVIKAEAVLTGQWAPPAVSLPAQFMAGRVKVHDPPATAGCFIARSNVAASCDHGETARWPLRHTATYLSRHPVLPYLLNGEGVLLAPSATGLYTSRGLTAACGAAFIATAVALAVSRRRPFLLLGVIVATTPSLLAGLGVLSSSPLEIGSGMLAFVLVALLASGEPVTTRMVVLTAVTLSVLALSRPVSFVWVAVAGAVGLLLLRRHELRDLIRRRDVQIGLGSVSLAMLVAVGWYFLLGAKPDPTCIDRCQVEPFLSLRLQKAYLQKHRTVRLMHVVSAVPAYWRQSLGAVGFNEYAGPWIVELGWTMLTAIVVGVGLVFSKLTRVLSVVFLAAVVVLLPIVVQFIYFLKTGPFWQGRYNLPLQAGLVILAAAALDGAARRVPELRRLLVPVIVACGLLQFAEFYASLRRYAVSVNGPLDALHWGHGWVPPLSSVALVVLALVALTATYGWFVFLARRTRVAEVRPG